MSRLGGLITRSSRDRKRLERLRLHHGCQLCGYKEHAAALHFHHVDPKEKFKAVMSLAGGSREVLEWELAKCAVLCANCHAVVHTTKATVDRPDPPLQLPQEED
jgi:5-methylcytosine-specific restriction endonuclease McrA